MTPARQNHNLIFVFRRSQTGQAVVELVVAIPILIALFGACLQLLHLGIAHIVVELAAYEATRLATLDNMNIAEARRTAEDICRVLGPGLTEVKYQSNPPGYEIIHHLRPIVPIIRELTVKHSLPSYVFLPGYELEPGSAVSPGQNRGGGGGGSPGYGGGRGGRGSGIEVADYDPDDYPNGGYSRSTYSSSQETYPQYAAAANPQTLPQGLEPYHSLPGADYSESFDDEYSDDFSGSSASYDPSDADLLLDPNLTSTDQNSTASLSGGSGSGFLPGSSRTAGDYLAAGASAVGRSIWPMPLLPTDTIAEAGKRARNKTGETGAEETTATAAAEQGQTEHGNGLLALASGAKDGYFGPSQRWGNELPNVKFANETEEAYKKKSRKYQEALDEMDKEADKEKGLTKAAKKAKIKTTKAAAAGSDILVEAVMDIPKIGQDLPEAVDDTKSALKNLKNKNYKAALYDTGKATGLVLKEADRLNPFKGIVKGAGKKLLSKAGKEFAENAGETAIKQTEKNLIKRTEKKAVIETEETLAKKRAWQTGKPGDNIASEKRTQHILRGDDNKGGHKYPGRTDKTPFPESWSEDKIMKNTSDIARDPTLKWEPDRIVDGKQRYRVVGERDGVRIRVIIEPDGEGIITAFPAIK